MHKRICVVVLAALAVLTGSATAAPKQKVALMPLQASEGVSAGLASVVTDALAVELQKRPGMSAVTPNDIETALKFERQKAKVSAEVAARTGNDVCIDDSCLAEIGGALGVDRMVSGNITRVGEMYFMTFQSFDPRKATVVARGQWRAKVGSEPELIDAAESVVDTLFGASPATKRPAGPAATSRPTPEAPRPNLPAVLREDSAPVRERPLRETAHSVAPLKPVAAPPSSLEPRATAPPARAETEAWSIESPPFDARDAQLEPAAPLRTEPRSAMRKTLSPGPPRLMLRLFGPDLQARVEVETAAGTQVCASLATGAQCVLEVSQGAAKLRASGDVSVEREVEISAGENLAIFSSGAGPGTKGLAIAGSIMAVAGGGLLVGTAIAGCFGEDLSRNVNCLVPVVLGSTFGGLGVLFAAVAIPQLLSAEDQVEFKPGTALSGVSAREPSTGVPEVAVGYSPSDRRKSISARWSF